MRWFLFVVYCPFCGSNWKGEFRAESPWRANCINVASGTAVPSARPAPQHRETLGKAINWMCRSIAALAHKSKWPDLRATTHSREKIDAVHLKLTLSYKPDSVQSVVGTASILAQNSLFHSVILSNEYDFYSVSRFNENHFLSIRVCYYTVKTYCNQLNEHEYLLRSRV